MTLNLDSWLNVISCTISDEELDRRFDAGYGTAEGVPFTLWTKDFVYFNYEYDGADKCLSVERSPSVNFMRLLNNLLHF